MLLWRKSGEIEAREEKRRLAEIHVATRDAVVRAMRSPKAGRWPRLWYLEPETKPRGLVPGDGLEEAIDRLDRATQGRNTGKRIH